MAPRSPALTLDPRCRLLPGGRVGPFAALSGGRLLTVEADAVLESADRGGTWSARRRVCRCGPRGRPSGEGVLLRTRRGTLVYVYMDMATYRWSWDARRREAGPEVRLDVWSVRSRDQGRTWTDRQQVFAGYCGALIDIVQTRGGAIVVPIQRLVREPSRHAIATYVSTDEGLSWEPSNVIDLGGHGHHDGAMEPTLEELGDGRLWMLIRTNWGRFWEAYSSDQGRSWRVLQPTAIDASSAPAYLLRLASGRLALAWNRLRATGRRTYPLRGGDGHFSLDRASWQRDELALALSSDDGRTWSEPVVVARRKGGGLSYPYLFEPQPGLLWITTRYSDRVALAASESSLG